MQALRDVIRQDICRKRSVVSDVLCHLKCLRLGITYALLIRHSLCFKGAANAPLKLFLLDILRLRQHLLHIYRTTVNFLSKQA